MILAIGILTLLGREGVVVMVMHLFLLRMSSCFLGKGRGGGTSHPFDDWWNFFYPWAGLWAGRVLIFPLVVSGPWAVLVLGLSWSCSLLCLGLGLDLSWWWWSWPYITPSSFWEREGVVVNRRHRALDDRGSFVDFPFPSLFWNRERL